MKIAILSRNTKLYSTQRLLEAGKKRGHSMHVVNTMRCYMNIATDKPTIHYNGKTLKDFDAVIPRIGASVTDYGTAVLRQFEMMGVFAVNESTAISRSRDKLRALQLLSRRGIGLPVTGFAHAPGDIPDLLNMIGKPPYVIKLLEGTQGLGVVLAEGHKSAQALIEAFMGINVHIMVQEFISEAKGSDLRCLVVDGRVVAAMQRTAAEGEFRSNLHRGGTASRVNLSAEEEKTAIRAAKILGLNVAGVDILRSQRGPVVLEVNSSPGLRGIEQASGIDVADTILDFVERNAGSGEEAEG